MLPAPVYARGDTELVNYRPRDINTDGNLTIMNQYSAFAEDGTGENDG